MEGLGGGYVLYLLSGYFFLYLQFMTCCVLAECKQTFIFEFKIKKKFWGNVGQIFVLAEEVLSVFKLRIGLVLVKSPFSVGFLNSCEF